MKRTKLIQRLNKPYKQNSRLAKLGNPFSFGGGYKNGGLTEDAMKVLAPLFSFDYMGAAEFEFGALPEAFMKIVEHSKSHGLVLETIDIELDKVEIGWMPKDVTHKTGKASVYVVCCKEDKDEVLKRVSFLVYYEASRNKNYPEDEMRLQERFGLGETIATEGRPSRELIGGLELDNGFFVTSDKDTAKAFFKIFTADEVDIPNDSPAQEARP